jgi:hypothetical protein
MIQVNVQLLLFFDPLHNFRAWIDSDGYLNVDVALAECAIGGLCSTVFDEDTLVLNRPLH